MAGSDVNLLDKSALKSLTALLVRLDENLFDDKSSKRLRKSSFERTKVGANIEYARNLLLRFGPETPQSQSQKGKRDGVQEKQAQLRRLQDRLDELNQLGDIVEDEDESRSNSEHEDLLSRYDIPAKDVINHHDDEDHAGDNNTISLITPVTAVTPNSTSTLRARRAGFEPAQDIGTATGSAASRNSGHSSTTPFTPKLATSAPGSLDNEKLLEHHSSEQEVLTDSLLELATALKNSTLAFKDTLDSSNPIVDMAVAALDKSVSGMEAAEKRMGMLRRMTEGRGWWGRLSLYGWIAVLWVVLILIMFVMPKLRF